MVATPDRDWETDEDKRKNFQDLEAGIGEYRKMLRDPVVKGMLNAWKNPVLRAERWIEPASEDSEDLRIAEEVESNFFENEHFSFDDWFRQVLFFNEFGFELMSKQFEVVDGRWRIRKFMHLKPETICGWNTDDNLDL